MVAVGKRMHHETIKRSDHAHEYVVKISFLINRVAVQKAFVAIINAQIYTLA